MMGDPTPDDVTFVYTFLSSDGVPLYVGCSQKIGHRLTAHIPKPWWPNVARIEIDAFPNLDAGLHAETARIRELQPVHNLSGTDKYNDALKGGWITRRAHLVGSRNRLRCYVPECVCFWPKTPEAQAVLEQTPQARVNTDGIAS